MNNFLVRSTLVSLIVISISTMWFANSGAMIQQPQRIVIPKPWAKELVSVVAVKTKNKEKIEPGKAFDEDDDWLDGFTVTIANNYSQTVTAITVEMVFRRDFGDSRPPLNYPIHLGPSPNMPEYRDRDRSKIIKAGKSADLHLTPQNYQSLKAHLERAGYTTGIKRVELVIREIGFEDGSMVDVGTFYFQDPAYPNDPTKKVKEPQPPSAQKT